MKFKLFIGDIAFGVLLSFILGLFVKDLAWKSNAVFAIAILSTVLSLILIKSFWREMCVFPIALLLGISYFHFFYIWKAAHTNLPIEKNTTFMAIISDEPQPSVNYLILTAKVLSPLSGIVKIIVPKSSSYGYGDLLQLTGKIMPSEDNSDPVLFSPKIKLIAHHRGFWLREKMIDLKLAILRNFTALLPSDQAALLGGIAFGSKQDFQPDLKSAMALSGLTHLVAVSGYNITIIILAARSVFGRYLSRRLTFIFACILLVLFMFMVGNAASGVRAAIMGFIALVARELGEAFNLRNAIAFTAAGMAIFDPTILTANLSFLLSFVSLLGIVYLGPPIKKLLHYSDPGTLDWKENGVTTFSAQLAVMPILINSFGTFSAMAIVANILVLSTVPLTMFFGLALAILGFISYYLAFFATKLVSLLLFYQLAMIKLFAALAVPLPLPLNSQFALLVYYLLLGIFIYSYDTRSD